MFNRQNFVKTKISLKIQLENKIFPIDGLCCCCCLFVNGEPLRRLFVDWALHSAEVRWRCTTVPMFFDDARQCRCSLTMHDSADVRWRRKTVPMFADDARLRRLFANGALLRRLFVNGALLRRLFVNWSTIAPVVIRVYSRNFHEHFTTTIQFTYYLHYFFNY